MQYNVDLEGGAGRCAVGQRAHLDSKAGAWQIGMLSRWRSPLDHPAVLNRENISVTI
jgi:hypothetical protein